MRAVHRNVLRLRWLTALFATACAGTFDATPSELLPGPSDLRCEGQRAPLGVETQEARLSWRFEAAGRSAPGTAFQVQAASDPVWFEMDAPDLWDTGFRAPFACGCAYEGKWLASRQRVWWRVRVRDGEGRVSPWSRPGDFTMGLLAASDWEAEWIAADPEPAPDAAVGNGVGWHALESAVPSATKWVQVDLGAPVLVESVVLHAVTDRFGHAIYGMPTRLFVDVADDPAFVSARALGRIDERTAPLARGRTSHAMAGDGRRARYGRVTTDRPWRRGDGTGCVAFAELEVFAGGRNVALHAKVSATDSWESEEWSAVALTDGVIPRIPPTTVSFVAQCSPTLPLRRALAFVAALGHYQLRLGREVVGSSWFTPGWTRYRETVPYVCYDVTEHFAADRVTDVVFTLTPGFQELELDPGSPHRIGLGPPKGVLQLEFDLADGGREVFVTNEQWRVERVPDTAARMVGGAEHEVQPTPYRKHASVVVGPRRNLRGLVADTRRQGRDGPRPEAKPASALVGTRPRSHP